MSANAFSRLDTTSRIVKRAQYEAFDFELCGTDILVRNCSHQHPAEHEYHVTIEDGLPTSCTCPADAAYDTPCKHRVAVAIRPRILNIATKAQAVTDGGVATVAQQDDDECDCDGLDDFPCWHCVETGRRELPDD